MREDSWPEASGFQDPNQKRGQLLPLARVQRSEQVLAVTAGDPSDLLQDVTPARGQVKRVAASVLRILPALHQSSVLQLIDEGDQPARRQPKGLGDHALIHAGRLSQDAEHPRMPWSEVERLQAPREPSRGGPGATGCWRSAAM